MKEYFLDFHSERCKCSKTVNGYEIYSCENNPERFLFYLANDFYLITYYRCIESYDKYDFKIELIKKVIEKNKIFEIYSINRGVDVNKDFKNFRIRNKNLRKNIRELNYIYYDACGKKIAITNLVPYVDKICDQHIVKQNYDKAKEFLQEKEYVWMLNSLDELYSHNIYKIKIEDVEIFKTVEYLIKSINQITK